MKRRVLSLAALAAMFLGLAGCASNLMQASPTGVVKAPASDKATVVFMRKSMVAAAIRADLFEVVDGKLKFIGQLPTGNKIAWETTPGRKIYMAYGNAADFMIADVRAGRTYYSIVRPNWGTGGFAPTPIRRDNTGEFSVTSPQFKEWSSTTLLEVKSQQEAQAWFDENREKLENIYKLYWNRFETKSPNEKAERTLSPEDGIPAS